MRHYCGRALGTQAENLLARSQAPHHTIPGLPRAKDLSRIVDIGYKPLPGPDARSSWRGS